MGEIKLFRPFRLETEYDEPVGRKGIQEHVKFLNFVYLFRFENDKVRWKVSGSSYFNANRFAHFKFNVPVFVNAVQQLCSPSDSRTIFQSDIDRFVRENELVSSRLITSLEEFEFEKIKAGSQYLESVNLLSAKWFRFVQTVPEFLKLYEDRQALTNANLVDHVQLSLSQQAEFLDCLSFSQIPEHLQLQQVSQLPAVVQSNDSNKLICEFNCSSEVFLEKRKLKRHRLTHHSVFNQMKCGCCPVFPYYCSEILSTGGVSHKAYKKIAEFASLPENIILNTVQSTLFPGTQISPIFEKFLVNVGALEISQVLQNSTFKDYKEVYDR